MQLILASKFSNFYLEIQGQNLINFLFIIMYTTVLQIQSVQHMHDNYRLPKTQKIAKGCRKK